MRKFSVVVNQIIALIPEIAPEGYGPNLTVLSAELRIMARTAAYTPSESSTASSQWARLETALYRYLPPPSAFPWCQQISILVSGS